MRAGGLLFVNATVFDTVPLHENVSTGVHVVPLAATTLAADIGNVMTASIVMIGAYAAVTGSSRSTRWSLRWQSLPPYRAQHIALNQRACRAGYAAAADLEAVAR